MKDFESGIHYLRKEGLKYGLIADSENDGVLIERLASIIRGQDPLKATNDALRAQLEKVREEAVNEATDPESAFD